MDASGLIRRSSCVPNRWGEESDRHSVRKLTVTLDFADDEHSKAIASRTYAIF